MSVRQKPTSLEELRAAVESLALEAAHYLMETKKIRLIGIDSVGVESRETSNYEVNVYLCQQGILILEGLLNLHQITQPVVWLEAFPLKIQGVEGTPCRAIAKQFLDA